MGAWGLDTFENDVACDWAYDLEETGMKLVETSLAAVLSRGSEIVDADVACEGLAACDVVARLRGKFGQRDAYTEDIDAWVDATGEPPSAKLLASAVAALDRIIGPDSELPELWEEAGQVDDWRMAVAALRARLTAE